MKKYKLLKDLFHLKAGEVVTISCDLDTTHIGVGHARALSIPTSQFERMSPEAFSETFGEIPETPKSIWDLKEGDEVIVDDLESYDGYTMSLWHNDEYQNEMRNTSRIYLSIANRNEEKSKIKACSKIKKFIHENDTGVEPDRGYKIYYSIPDREFYVMYALTFISDTTLPSFKTEEDAQKIIETFSEELKIIFNIK